MAFRDRLTEDYLAGHRNSIVDSFSQRDARVEAVDRLIRGEWTMTYPDGTSTEVSPMIGNLADTVPRDVARLVTETSPSVKCYPVSDEQRDIDNAVIRERVHDGYWQVNQGDLMIPQFAMDLVITGTAFTCVWAEANSNYPIVRRIDPRFCYPDVHNGVVQDLLVVQQVKRRILQRLWPDVDLGLTENNEASMLEVWEYYSADECVRAVAELDGKTGRPIGAGNVYIVKRWFPGIGVVPVGFAQLPSPDGGFRGLLDQLSGPLQTKNKGVQYMTDYLHQMVHTPFEAKGILNASDEPGPNTIYQHDPVAQESFMRRVPPAQPSGQAFAVISNLDSEMRSQAAYPASRQGEVGQSIASAAFVASTQGALTSVVRDVQRLIGSLREQSSRIAARIDVAHLDFEKPLQTTTSKARIYLPSRVFKDTYDAHIVYGAGAGLDRLNTDNRLLQYYGAGILDAETVLGNTDFVSDPASVIEKRQKDEVERIILQRFAQDPTMNMDFILAVYRIQREQGLSLVDALVAAQAEQATQQAQAAQGAEMLPQEQTPNAAAEQLAIQKGGTPATPLAPAPFQPTKPLEQILIRA